jgi:ACT domain-containing protein
MTGFLMHMRKVKEIIAFFRKKFYISKNVRLKYEDKIFNFYLYVRNKEQIIFNKI